MKVRDAIAEIDQIKSAVRYLNQDYERKADEHTRDSINGVTELLDNYLDLLNKMLDKAELKI